MNVKKRIRLHFEDKGQDFLWWDIEYWTANDLFGLVVDCGPFQASVWVGNTVLMQTCHDFGHVEFGKRDEEENWETRRLNYEIEKREELPATAEEIDDLNA